MATDATTFLSMLASEHPQVSDKLQMVTALYEKKMWHQLTGEVLALVKDEYFHGKGDVLTALFENFLITFADKLNQLTFTEIGITIAKQQAEAAQLDFVTALIERLDQEKDMQAFVLGRNVLASLHLAAGRTKEARALLDENQKLLDAASGLETIVYSTFYDALGTFEQTHSAANYFKAGLMYLCYTPLQSMPVEQQKQVSHDLAIAALVGENIFNFGELLSHPIFQCLQGTPEYGWLFEFMLAFNSGDIHKYNATTSKWKKELEATDVLVKNNKMLQEKITLLCLMELVFRLPADARNISFEQVAAATQVDASQVEFLLMRALSLKLIRGVIDEVNQTVQVTWVQPRVLDLDQINSMKDRLKEWSATVGDTLNLLEGEAKDLLA